MEPSAHQSLCKTDSWPLNAHTRTCTHSRLSCIHWCELRHTEQHRAETNAHAHTHDILSSIPATYFWFLSGIPHSYRDSQCPLLTYPSPPSSLGLTERQFNSLEKHRRTLQVLVSGWNGFNCFSAQHTMKLLKVGRGVVTEWSDNTEWELSLCSCCLFLWMQMPPWSVCLLICVDERLRNASRCAQRLNRTSRVLTGVTWAGKMGWCSCRVLIFLISWCI